MSLAPRPVAIGSAFKCTSLEEANAALHELGWLDSFEKTIEAETKEKIEKIKQQAKERFTLSIDQAEGEPLMITIDDRRAVLVKAVTAWASRHLVDHIEKGARSIKLSHGTIGYRLAPLAVEFAEGCTEKTVVATIEKKSGLVALLSATLNTLISRVALSSLIRLKAELNKDGIKALWQTTTKPIRSAIEKFGIKVTGGEDALYLDPTKHVTAPPA